MTRAIANLAFRGLPVLTALLASCAVLRPDSEALKKRLSPGIVRLSSTIQIPAFHAPWIWRPTMTRSGQGVIVGKNLVLTLASNVINAKVIRATFGDEPEPIPLTVKSVNFDANLALLTGNLPQDATPLAVPNISVFKHAAPLRMYWKTGNGTLVEGSAILDKADARFNFNSFQTHIMFHAIRSSHPKTGYGVPVFDDKGNFFGLATQGGNEYDFIIVTCDTMSRAFDLKKGEPKPPTGMPGFSTSPLTQRYLRQKLGLSGTDGGCLVTKVFQQGSGHTQLKEGDVLLALDGRKLDAWGRYKHPIFGPLFHSHLFSEHFVTESMKADIVRDGKKMTLNLKLSAVDDSKWLVPFNPTMRATDYVVRGGFVFLPLTLTYIKEWGGNYYNIAPIPLLLAWENNKGVMKSAKRHEVVVLSRVLSHPSNMGLQTGDCIVAEVNDRPLGSLKELKKALDDTSSKVVKLTLMPGRIPLWLSPKVLKQADEEIRLRYGINQLYRMAPDGK